MAVKVTMQDIADSLGISRNTVSKAINNTGSLSDATKDRVITKAIEMGYKQFSYMNTDVRERQGAELQKSHGKRDISLFATGFIGDSHFASTMIDKFQREITQLGYHLVIHRILPEELEALQLPSAFNKETVAGIICIEMFHYEYNQMVCSLDMPVLFVDSSVCGYHEPLRADRLYMDNQSCIYALVKEMADRGKRRIGFIGEYLHCQSFFERYMAYRNAMYLMGLPCQEKYCIIGNAADIGYSEYLMECLSGIDDMPDVFLCANDFVAIDTLNVMQKLGISVPDDVYLCGFDDSPEAKLITPSLTTIHIHSQIMGLFAAQLLCSRIQEPTLDFRTVYAETSLVYRESTGDKPQQADGLQEA